MTGEPRRREIPEIPYDAMREAIINAVAHRDYFEKGANVMVEMFDDRIEITNPGGLVKGLRPEDFGKKSVLRNPNIANLLHRIKYIEKMGTGISKMRRLVKSAGLRPVKFEFETFFTATFWRPKRRMPTDVEIERGKEFGIKFGTKFGIKGSKLKRITDIIDILYTGETFSIAEFAIKTGVTTRVIEKDIKWLREQGIVDFWGARKTGKYVLTEEGKEIIEELKKLI